MWRDSGSSVSSQCMSTSRPRFAAISQSARHRAAPSAMVRSKCGMPPTTSTPRSSARSRLLRGARRAVVAVLRKGDELQVEIGRDPPLHLEQRLDREQPRRRRCRHGCGWPAGPAPPPSRNRRSARSITASARQQRLQLAPELDALEQRAGLVQARQAERQRRIHVEMASTKGGADQPARARRSLARLGLQVPARPRRCGSPTTPMSMPVRPSGRLAPRMMRSIHARGQCGRLRSSPFRYGTISARG